MKRRYSSSSSSSGDSSGSGSSGSSVSSSSSSSSSSGYDDDIVPSISDSNDSSDSNDEEERPCQYCGKYVKRFYQPNERIMMVGTSNSGKTTLLLKLLAHQKRHFKYPITKLLWYYGKGTKQPLHDKLQHATDTQVIMKEGVPQDIDADLGLEKCPPKQTWMVVFDDLMEECGKTDVLKNAVNKLSHHRNCVVVYLTQNVFHQRKHTVTCARNMSEVVSIVEGRTRQAIRKYLFDAGYTKKQVDDINNWIDENTKDKPYSNFAINHGMRHDRRCRLRMNICPDEEKGEFTRVYHP